MRTLCMYLGTLVASLVVLVGVVGALPAPAISPEPLSVSAPSISAQLPEPPTVAAETYLVKHVQGAGGTAAQPRQLPQATGLGGRHLMQALLGCGVVVLTLGTLLRRPT